MLKLDGKITAYKVMPNTSTTVNEQKPVVEQYIMNEHVKRPDHLFDSTYKIKQPTSGHALYITINDYVFNPDTQFKQYFPYEVFINSKNMEYYQCVVAITRLISAVFRKGGNVAFISEELKGVFDPKGGYFKKGGVFVPSLVAEIGMIIEKHLIKNGIIQLEKMFRYFILF